MIPRKTLIIMTVLLGSLFVGTTAVHGKVLKIDIMFIEYIDFSAYDPGTSWEAGGTFHEKDVVYKFDVVFGDVLGVLWAYQDVMKYDMETWVGVGSGSNELIGTWMREDQFYGLPIYWYGHSIFRSDGTFFYGWANTHGYLGDYEIHFKGTYGPAPDPWVWGTIISGEITIHL
ncbi:MAG: hypothetical protein FK732_08020 [Asgard group archaeon]|nr:hypothetical protein [Asgard group archaeon]